MSFCFLALTVPLNSELLRPAGALAFGHHHQSLKDSPLMKAKRERERGGEGEGGGGGRVRVRNPRSCPVTYLDSHACLTLLYADKAGAEGSIPAGEMVLRLSQ